MVVKKKDEALNYSDSDLYFSPYPGTAVGKVDHLLKRSSLFSETANQNDGDYGRGPNGWTRSDKCLEEEVSFLLFLNPAVDAEDVSVEVEDGVIFLKGSVRNQYMKWVAERSVEGIEGVKEIENLLEIKALKH